MTADPGAIPPATLSLLRQFADLVVTDEITPEEWHRLHDALEAVLRHREAGAIAESQYAASFRGALADDPTRIPDVRHPISVGATLVFPPLSMAWDGDTLRATIRFGPAFEGPPGLVHGGFVATGFDVIVSSAAWHLTPLMMTRRLNVRYFRPTRIGQDATFEARPSWIDERRVRVDCRLADENGKTTARAEGECVALSVERFSDRFASEGVADGRLTGD